MDSILWEPKTVEVCRLCGADRESDFVMHHTKCLLARACAEMKRQLDAAVITERNRCAQVVEVMALEGRDAQTIANAIRRGDTL